MKAKYLLKVIFLNVLSVGCGYAQGLRNESAYITLRGGVDVWVATNNQGHYTSNGTGRIKVITTGTTSASSPTIDVYGNWINNASNTGFYNDSSNVRLLATANQTIGGTSSTTFYNLYLGGSGIKTMTNNISVGGQSKLNGLLNLTTVELNLNQYTLTITNPTMTIAYTSGYINSESGTPGTNNIWPSAVTWSAMPNISRIIPFGLSSTQIPMSVNKTAGSNVDIAFSTRASSGGANNTPIPSTVTAMNVPAMSVTQTNDGTNTVIDRWWYITPNTTSATPVSLDLNFTYRGAENTCTGCPQTGNFGAQYWVEYSGTNKGWKLCAGPSWTCSTMGTWPGVTTGTQNASTTTGNVSLPDGGNNTSYWVLSCTAKPLPIELVAFNAFCQNNGATLLSWKTATEVNALKFEIQKSNNGTDYTTIASINAQYPYGGSYTFTDLSKNSGIVYYRLKMIDKDGSFKYSPIQDVGFDKCNGIKTQIYAYEKNIILNINSDKNQKLKFELIDVLGRIIMNKFIDVSEGANSFQYTTDAAQSVYFVKLTDEKDNLIQTQKIIIQN